jgi:hypothetical protein
MDDETGIFEIDVDGRIDAGSYRELVDDLETAITAKGKVAVLETVKSLGWMSPEVWLEDLFWSSRHMSSFTRVALVTDTGWLATMATTATMAFPIRFRTFPLAEAEAARAWLTA